MLSQGRLTPPPPHRSRGGGSEGEMALSELFIYTLIGCRRFTVSLTMSREMLDAPLSLLHPFCRPS